jgi:hypothetical protein
VAKGSKALPDRFHFFCPGCEQVHGITYAFPAPYGSDWAWNGDVDLPTISPSILVQGGAENVVCHSYVTDGRIQFLNDSTHKLSGQTVDLPDWPFSRSSS